MANPKNGEADKGDAPKSRRMLLIGVGAVVLAAGGGGFAYWKSRAKAPQAEAKKVAVFVDLPDITINLAQSPGQDRQSYLKLKLALELPDQKMADQVKPLMPRLLDNFQVYLRELKATDLEGSAGLYRLKEELVRRTNVAIHPAKIDALLFKDILVQ